jgi:hypothetical protein
MKSFQWSNNGSKYCLDEPSPGDSVNKLAKAQPLTERLSYSKKIVATQSSRRSNRSHFLKNIGSKKGFEKNGADRFQIHSSRLRK